MRTQENKNNKENVDSEEPSRKKLDAETTEEILDKSKVEDRS